MSTGTSHLDNLFSQTDTTRQPARLQTDPIPRGASLVGPRPHCVPQVLCAYSLRRCSEDGRSNYSPGEEHLAGTDLSRSRSTRQADLQEPYRAWDKEGRRNLANRCPS